MQDSRTRFLSTMAFAPCDRPPLWEEGIREDLWEEWRLAGGPSPEDLAQEYKVDRRSTIGVKLDPVPQFDPGEVADRYRRLVQHYQPDVSARLPKGWVTRAVSAQEAREPTGMQVHRGVFLTLGVRDWRTLSDLMLAMADRPGQLETVLECASDLSLRVLDAVTRKVPLDFATLSEPIASFSAPLISPRYYGRFAIPACRRITDALRACGVGTVIVQAYGNIRPILPLLLESGVNTLWCSHTQPSGMDYVSLRSEFGKGLRLIGGLDARALQQGHREIDDVLWRTAAPLLSEGGYLPLLDDRVRPGTPFESCLYYRRQLEGLVRKG